MKQTSKLYKIGSLSSMVLACRAGDREPEMRLRSRAERLAQFKAVPAAPTVVTWLSLAQATWQMNTSKAPEMSLANNLPRIRTPEVLIPDERSLISLVKDETYLEWLVNIKAQKHAPGGEHLVHIFLGRVREDEPTILYSISPYHVGTFAPLGQSEKTRCGKCQEDQAARTEITGQIPLTIALIERYFAGVLKS